MSGYMYNVNAIKKLSDQELSSGSTKSWHDQYSDSAWVFVGGLPYELTEGDVLCVFSQYGEIVNINMVRDKKTGKPKGFAFICYENQKSTVLAVDNFNGVKIKGRTIRVDHVANYRVPKEHEDEDDVTKKIRQDGVAPRTPSPSASEEEDYEVPTKKPKKEKRKKEKSKKKDKEKRIESSASGKSRSQASQSRSTSQSDSPPVRVKKEKDDPGYRVAELGRHAPSSSDTLGGERKDRLKQEGYSYTKENRGAAYREERSSAGTSRDSRSTAVKSSRDYAEEYRRTAVPRNRGGEKDKREAHDRQDYKNYREDRDRRELQSSQETEDKSYRRERDDRNPRGRSHHGRESRGMEGRKERDSGDRDRNSHVKESKATEYRDPWDRSGREKEKGKERERLDRRDPEERYERKDRGSRDRR